MTVCFCENAHVCVILQYLLEKKDYGLKKRYCNEY